MKLRLATPSVLVDIGRLPDLRTSVTHGDHVAVGALTRHRDLETSELLAGDAPLLRTRRARSVIPQVRHRGTIGGSIAHGDPASDLPAVLLALERRWWPAVRAASATIAHRRLLHRLPRDRARRRRAADRDPGAEGRRRGWSFQKFNRRAQDWAIVGVAAVSEQRLGPDRPGEHGLDPGPAAGAEEALAGGRVGGGRRRRRAARARPADDLNATPEFRRHLAEVLVRRALESAGVA